MTTEKRIVVPDSGKNRGEQRLPMDAAPLPDLIGSDVAW